MKGSKNITGSKVWNLLLDNLAWLLGCFLYAVSVIVFAVPNEIAQSGITGLAIIFNALFNTPVGLLYFLLNIPLIIAAWRLLGWKFVAKTLWVTVLLSVMLDALKPFLPVYRGDRLLAAGTQALCHLLIAALLRLISSGISSAASTTLDVTWLGMAVLEGTLLTDRDLP